MTARFLSRGGTRPARRTAPDALALLAAIVLPGIFALSRGQDASWDLCNYHLYNPWAWLTGRTSFDIAAAQLQSFLNPLADVPLYLMVAANWPPRAVTFVLAMPAGAGAFFLWKLAMLLLRDMPPVNRRIVAVTAVAVGVTGAAGLSQLGTTTNEWTGAALVLAALWLLARDIASATRRPYSLPVAGALLGIAAGLKLTAATYGLGAFVALLFRPRQHGATRDAAMLAGSMLAGLIATSGFWMAHLYRDFGSPLFPYFNQWLHSPLVAQEPGPRMFGPRTLTEWLRVPYDIAGRRRGEFAETRYVDWRITVLFAIGLASLVAIATRRLLGTTETRRDVDLAAAWRFLAGSCAAAFVAWLAVHSIYRYVIPIEMLSGLLIAGAVTRLAPVASPRAITWTIVAIGVALVATTRSLPWTRVAYGARFVEVSAPAIEPDALVLLAAGSPMSCVLPALPPTARHVGIENNIVQSWEQSGLRDRATAVIAAHRGPVYALASRDSTNPQTLPAYGLAEQPGSCAEIRANISAEVLRLCRVQRLDESERR